MPWHYHAKFGGNWTTNKGETGGGGGAQCIAHIVPKYPILNRVKFNFFLLLASLFLKAQYINFTWTQVQYGKALIFHSTSSSFDKITAFFEMSFGYNSFMEKI